MRLPKTYPLFGLLNIIICSLFRSKLLPPISNYGFLLIILFAFLLTALFDSLLHFSVDDVFFITSGASLTSFVDFEGIVVFAINAVPCFSI